MVVFVPATAPVVVPPPPPPTTVPVDAQVAIFLDFLDWMATNPSFKDFMPIVRYAHENPDIDKILKFAVFVRDVRQGKREQRNNNIAKFNKDQKERLAG